MVERNGSARVVLRQVVLMSEDVESECDVLDKDSFAHKVAFVEEVKQLEKELNGDNDE